MGDTSDRVLLKAWNRTLGREQNVQASFNCLKMVPSDHAMIHEGVGFQTSHTDSLAAAGVHMMLVKPNSAGMHLRQLKVVTTGAPIITSLYEASSYSAAGTAQPIFNRNRLSTRVSSTTIFDAPTIVVTGTQLEPILIPVTAKDSGGEGEGLQQEWVLGGGKDYLVGINNLAGAGIGIGIKLFWYEPYLL